MTASPKTKGDIKTHLTVYALWQLQATQEETVLTCAPKTILTLLTLLLNHWYSLFVSDVPTKCIQTCTDILSLSLSLPSGLGTPTDKQDSDLETEAD